MGFPPELTVCLALSREMGAPTSAPACCFAGAFAKPRPAFRSTALAVPSFQPPSPVQESGWCWVALQASSEHRPALPAKGLLRTPADPSAPHLPLGSNIVTSLASSHTYTFSCAHTQHHPNTSPKQSLHTPIFDHIGCFAFK